MRLHRIHVENLNSLVGPHEVDLEHGLAGAPLFLITGPTGAGKSTLLDAVCLALFGETPRLDKGRGSPGRGEIADTDPSHVISHGTGAALAELEWSIRHEGAPQRYRATWSCHRARKRADGAPQRPRRTLHVLDSASGEWRAVVESTRELDWREPFAVARDGLTIEDFRRSVLLAQGEFAAFVRASESERASILERLTATDLYRQLGAAANRKRQASEKHLAEVRAESQGLQVMPEAEAGLYRAELAVREARRQVLQARRRSLEQRRGWVLELVKARAARAAAIDERAALARRRHEATPALDRLAEHERVRDAFPILQAAEGARSAAASAAQELPQAQALESAAASERVERAGAHAAAVELARRSRETHDQKRPEIERGRALRRDGAVLESAVPDLTQERDGARQAREAAEARHLETLAAAAQREAAVAPLRERAATLEPIRGFASAVEKFVDAATPWATRTKRWAEQRADHRRLIADGAEIRRELEDLRRELGDLSAGASGAASVRREAAAEAAGVHEQIEATRRRASEIAAASAQTAADLADFEWALNLAQERGRLRSGVACPLCGALEHPVLDALDRDGADARLQARCTALHKDKQRLDDTAATLASAVEVGRGRLAVLTELRQQLEQRGHEVESALAGLSGDADRAARIVDDAVGAERGSPLPAERGDRAPPGAAITAVTHQELASVEGGEGDATGIALRLDRLEKTLRAEASSAGDLRRSLDQLRGKAGALRERVRAWQESLVAAQDQVEKGAVATTRGARSLGASLAGLIQGLGPHAPAEASAAAQALEGARLDALQVDDVGDLADRVERASQSLRGLIVTAEAAAVDAIEAETKAREFRHAAELLAANLGPARAREQAAEDALAANSSALASLRQELSGCLGGADPDELDRRLQRICDEAQTAADAARDALSVAESEFAVAESKRIALEQTAKKSAADLSDANDELRAKVSELGLPGEAALRERILEPGEVERSIRLRAALLADDEASANRLAGADAALAGLEEAPPADIGEVPLDDLTDALTWLDLSLQQTDLESQEVNQRIGTLSSLLNTDADNRRRSGEIAQRIAAAEAAHALQTRLHELIGVGEGDAFRRFAQALNLEELLARANRRLESLAPRYRLVSSRQAGGAVRLDFSVRDRDHAGQVRPLTTLSGGETFLVSLALALALADTRGARTPIETLLLDEGFGSLDSETLQVAMAALEALHQTGVQVGVISHVEALRERIDARIVVERVGNGRSRVRVEAPTNAGAVQR